MIPKAPIKTPTSEGVTNPVQEAASSSDTGADEMDGPSNLAVSDMSAALPPRRGIRRAEVKKKDWRASIQAYNELWTSNLSKLHPQYFTNNIYLNS